MATPSVGFLADVTAAENAEVAWEFKEFLYDSVLVYAAQEAKTTDFWRKVGVAIVLEIVFKLKALGVLVIYGSANNISLIGGCFIRQYDIGFVVEVGHNVGREGEAGRKWNMSIIKTLLVKL